MDASDRKNLNFLLNVSEEVLNDWLMQADNDDLEYAIHLIKIAKLEYVIKQIDKIDEVNDFSDAEMVIEKIKNLK